ncbi:MAG TPA: alanine racemase, partial [Candidatus Caenarcaniphilales bacterium]|nr:alanine racemase [Candidatus Caenarcaniphilales bacterium]
RVRQPGPVGVTASVSGPSIDERLARAALPPLPRSSWLEIDEEALAGNLRLVRELVGPRVEISAVIKADAYGHGIEAAARVFVSAGTDRLCVASLDEALHLRDVGVEAPILVLFAIPPAAVADAAVARVELVAAEEGNALALLECWRNSGLPERGTVLSIHLEAETGLARAGLAPERVGLLAQRIIATPGTRLAGLWSHLASSNDPAASAAQVSAFDRAVRALSDAGVPLPRRHLAATGGLFAGSAPVYDGVRPGLSLYGLIPADFPIAEQARAVASRLRPAMALKCRPLRIEALPADTPVGYGGVWRTARPSLVATLPVGYGDGWSRSYSPGAAALVRGRRVPLVGSVAMDAVMADVTELPGVGPTDEFVLLGEQGDERITAQDLARLRNTIVWEVVTTMAQRLPRVYHSRAVLLGTRTLAGEVRVDSPSERHS